MYLNYNDMNLTVTKGDTHAFAVEIDGITADLTSAYFTVKKNWDDTSNVFQKSLGDGITKVDTTHYRVRIAPADTALLEDGLYCYDLVIYVNGDIYTLLKGYLRLEHDVTSHSETIVETPVLSGYYLVSVVDETLILSS